MYRVYVVCGPVVIDCGAFAEEWEAQQEVAQLSVKGWYDTAFYVEVE